MEWDDLETALQFLEKPDDRICIQVPYASDLRLVQDYIMERHAAALEVTSQTDTEMRTKKGTIRFEFVSSGMSGVGMDCPCFLVARENGDIGMSPVDYGE